MYYVIEIGMYYLQSRYYDTVVGRFVNGDDTFCLDIIEKITNCHLFGYCENNPTNMIDIFGFWAEKYAGFKLTLKGFNVDKNINFLSRKFCLSYAGDIVKRYGGWCKYRMLYKNMDKLRIAQELWFHAIVYYVGTPIKKIFKKLKISSKWLDDIIKRAKYIEINNNDNRVWAFVIAWWAAYYIKSCLRSSSGLYGIYSYIHI